MKTGNVVFAIFTVIALCMLCGAVNTLGTMVFEQQKAEGNVENLTEAIVAEAEGIEAQAHAIENMSETIDEQSDKVVDLSDKLVTAADERAKQAEDKANLLQLLMIVGLGTLVIGFVLGIVKLLKG